MKTKFLLFALFTGLMTQTKSQNTIPNSSFENWTSINNQFEIPDQWQTNVSADNNAIERDNYAQDGNSALQVNPYGYASTGFPVTEHPGIVSFYVHTAYAMMDTVNITVTVFSQGMAVDGGSWTNSGDAAIPNWSYVMVPISQNVSGADSVIIMITGGQRAGTILSVDKLSFDEPTRGHNAANLINNWLLYPNPATNYVDLQFSVPATTNLTMKLYDMQGQLITTFFDNLYLWTGNYTKRLDISSLASGNYLLYIYDGQERTSLKLDIQNSTSFLR
jgi:hypothetical protein